MQRKGRVSVSPTGKRMIDVVATLPRNADVADQFDLLADLLELEGAESFRVLAYRRAATRMRETSGSVAQLALEGKAKDLPGIGKTIEEKIVQIVETGEIEALGEEEGARSRRRWSASCGSPASGRRPPRGSGRSWA